MAPDAAVGPADDGTVAAQLPVSTKTNEIPMFAPLLDRIEDLTDTVVTAGQLHTQRATWPDLGPFGAAEDPNAPFRLALRHDAV
jgi:hypothetical protein